MKVNRSCRPNIRRRLPCFEHCYNWVKNNDKSLNRILEDDLKYTKKFEKHLDVNVKVLMTVAFFIVACFIAFMIFNMAK